MRPVLPKHLQSNQKNMRRVYELFFDFYAITTVKGYIDAARTILSSYKEERLSFMAERVVDEIYEFVKDALTYSVYSEASYLFRRYRTSKGMEAFDCGPATLNKWTKSKGVYRKRSWEVSLGIIYEGFQTTFWELDYGGTSWAEGTKFLLDLPKTYSEKIIWVDRVFDLQHNTGHMLNKTVFHVISEDTYSYPKFLHEEVPRDEADMDYDSPLDYKAVHPVGHLLCYVSDKVYRICKSNLHHLPQALVRGLPQAEAQEKRDWSKIVGEIKSIKVRSRQKPIPHA